MFSKLEQAIHKDVKMSPELWAQLQEFGTLRKIKKNAYLLKAGEVCHHGYFINSGSLVQTFLNKNGKEVVQGFYIEDTYTFLSSVTSYFSEKGSDFEIKAIENCEVIAFSREQLTYMVNEFHEFAIFFHQITARGFQNLYLFSAMRLSLNAEEFLRFLYDEYPIYLQRIPDKYVAQFMGVSKEWLSKLKKKVLKEKH